MCGNIACIYAAHLQTARQHKCMQSNHVAFMFILTKSDDARYECRIQLSTVVSDDMWPVCVLVFIVIV